MDIIRDTESLVDRVLGKKVLEDKKEEARRSCGRRRCAAILDGATPDVSAIAYGSGNGSQVCVPYSPSLPPQSADSS